MNEHQYSILVVDDDEGVLLLYTAALQRAGYNVLSSKNGVQAIDMLKKHDVAVTVTDIMMPDMDGLTLLKKMKEKNPEAIVIFITAYAQLDSALFAIKEGAFAYLKKPFNPGELLDSVKNAIAKHQFLRENKKVMDELYHAKKYNDSILEHLVFTVVATDLDGRITRVNHATEALLGYKEEELVGRSIESILSKDFFKAQWKNMIAEKKVKDYPVTFLRKDGATVSLLFSGSVMKDENSKPIGILGTAHFSM